MPADCATQQHAAPRPRHDADGQPEDLDEAFRDDARAFDLSLDALAESHQDDDDDSLYAVAPQDDEQRSGHEIKQEAQSPHASPGPPRPTPPQRSSSSGSTSSARKSPRRSAKPSTAKKTAVASGSKRGGVAAPQPFSWNDILRVQSLIERCLQQYLSKNEIVTTLKTQAEVDPSFTAVVWQKLEEQNPAFFRAYSLRLQLKEQIAAFNYLVSQQKEMMTKAGGNAAFLSFLAGSDARSQQRSAPNATRASRLARSGPSPVTSGFQGGVTFTSSSSTSVEGFDPSPLPLPSPIKTDLDTHAFFS